jgi:hypothetical protein
MKGDGEAEQGEELLMSEQVFVNQNWQLCAVARVILDRVAIDS